MKPYRFTYILRDRFNLPRAFAFTVWSDSRTAAFRAFHRQAAALARRWAIPGAILEKEDAYALAR
jgi:hypothetical protein